MKLVKTWTVTVMLLLLVLGVTACSEEDDLQNIPTRTELVGTTWAGITQGIALTIQFTNQQSAAFVLTDVATETTLQSGRGSYSYNEMDGSIDASLSGYSITGQATKDKISLQIDDEMRFTLKKVNQ